MSDDCQEGLVLHQTARFSVVEIGHAVERAQPISDDDIPVLPLDDLLLHRHRNISGRIHKRLLHALSTQGFCLISISWNSRPGEIVQELQRSIERDLFPASGDVNAARLRPSETVYVSERDVPMYRLGYERMDDIRQVFRVAAARPDEQPWPDAATRTRWLRGLALLRHVTDAALELLLRSVTNADTARRWREALDARPHAGGAAWLRDRYAASEAGSLAERADDYSLLYAMHYFGSALAEAPGVAVKAHVDPSLLVLEPFLSRGTRGLQVWDRRRDCWLDCDGPASPLRALEDDDRCVMLLFVGRGLQSLLPELEPTLHRVIASTGPRRTVIYEQKYGEYYA